MKKIIVGHNFLHPHPFMQDSLELDEDHVIVNKADLEKVVRFFESHRELEQELGKEDKFSRPVKKRKFCNCGLLSIGCNSIKESICPKCGLPVQPS